MSWNHLGDTTQKAKKTHRCYLCGGQIEVGDAYVRRTGTDEGRFLVLKMHMDCEQFTRNWRIDDWEGFFPGDLWMHEMDFVSRGVTAP